MKNVRRVLAGLVLAGFSLGAVAISADHGGSNDDARRKCRWAIGHGVVCDVGGDTITL